MYLWLLLALRPCLAHVRSELHFSCICSCIRLIQPRIHRIATDEWFFIVFSRRVERALVTAPKRVTDAQIFIIRLFILTLPDHISLLPVVAGVVESKQNYTLNLMKCNISLKFAMESFCCSAEYIFPGSNGWAKLKMAFDECVEEMRVWSQMNEKYCLK